MKASMTAKPTLLVLILCALLFSLALGAACAESPVLLSQEAVRLAEQCEAVFDGSTLVVTDTDDNNDVWSSKLLLDAGMALTPGETYTVSFDLAGENGVGEFFLCKSENIDDRYDETFAAEAGNRSIAFTAAGEKLYIGLQVGNLGKGCSVTAAIPNLSLLSESGNPGLLRMENCEVSLEDGVITATDNSDNNDVWNSKVLYDAGVQLEPGKAYKLSFTLSGDGGVGEFFVCKSMDLNNRCNPTFVNSAGQKNVIFKAAGERLYIGLQFGNLGKGGSVTLSIGELRETGTRVGSVQPRPSVPYVPVAPGGGSAAPAGPSVLQSENCSYEMESAGEQTVIKAVDTGSNDSEVWNSKLLVFLGDLLEKNGFYAANIHLSGDNGVGEFFFCKEDNLDKRYSFDNQPGDHTPKFKAEDTRLYAGMQFGNIGKGNEATAEIRDIFRVPGMQTSSENCAETLAENKVTLTDTDDNPDVWNSKAVYDTGIELEPGKEYTATFTLTGDSGVGEFFFLKSNNIDERYTFNNQPGTHTVTFTADGTALYFGLQCGNIGNGNSVSVSDISVSPAAGEGE